MISWSFMGDEDCCYGGRYLAGRRDAQPGSAQASLSLSPSQAAPVSSLSSVWPQVDHGVRESAWPLCDNRLFVYYL